MNLELAQGALGAAAAAGLGIALATAWMWRRPYDQQPTRLVFAQTRISLRRQKLRNRWAPAGSADLRPRRS